MIAALLVAGLAFQGTEAWERFIPGSYVEFQTTTTQGGKSVKTFEKTVLRLVTDAEVVLTTESTDGAGQRLALEVRNPRPQRAAPAEDFGAKTGTENVTVDGKAWPCEIREKRGVRRWICADVKFNGGVLKSEAIKGSDKVLTRVIKVEDKVRVGSATVACWVREDVTETADQKTVRTQWFSGEVPGGLVRVETRQSRGAEVIEKTDTLLTAFDVVKK